MTPRSTQVRLLLLVAMAALFLGFPVNALGHAELDVPTPDDGATVEGSPPEVAGTFTQAIEPEGSALVLRDEANEVAARGGPDPNDVHRMLIPDLPELVPGTYEVQWTTISAEDGELARGTWSFTVVPAPTPTPTAVPTPSSSASAETTPSPTPERTAAPTPTASPAPSDPANASGTDVILPIIAGLAIVLAVAGFLLARRGRPSDSA